MNQDQDQKLPNKSSTNAINPKLLELLWKLKEQYQTTIDSKIPLNKLIQNLDYRKSILNSALNSPDEKSRDLAWEILCLQKEIEFDEEENGSASQYSVKRVLPARQANASESDKIIEKPITPKQKIPQSNTQQSVLPPVLKNNDSAIRKNVKTKNQNAKTNNIKAIPGDKYRFIALAAIALATISILVSLTLSSRNDVGSNNQTATTDDKSQNFSNKISSISRSSPVINNPLFVLHGSNTIGEKLAPALIKAYFKNKGAVASKTIVTGDTQLDRHIVMRMGDGDDIAVELASHGSSTGFKSLIANQTDIAMSSRMIKSTEVEKLFSQFGSLKSPRSEHIIGLDGLAIIVHPENPVSSLNTKQIAQLFSGEIKNWKQLGGKNEAVHIYAREKNSGTWDTFKSLVLKPNKTRLTQSATRYESSSELSDNVAADPGGIGFIALPYVRYSKLLSVSEGADAMPVVPTAFTIGTEDYPLSRRLYLYVPQSAQQEVKSFIEFVHSTEGQDVVQKHGFVSQNIYAMKPYRDQSFPTQYLALTQNAQRLSLNFRFDISSNNLDNKANRDMNRVVDYLFQNQGHKVMLFGFTDSVGGNSQNLALSQQRVRTIEQALASRGIFPSVAKGFGEAIPIASNATSYGRYKNRRVEVWIE